MKIQIVLFALMLMGTSLIAQSTEEEKVRIPLEHYLKGHETGLADHMRAAFHTEGHLMFVKDGKYSTISFSDYIGRMNGQAAKDESERKRHIESVDVAGTAATAKIILDYPSGMFIDYMSLLKIDGEWKIVNKIFYRKSS